MNQHRASRIVNFSFVHTGTQNVFYKGKKKFQLKVINLKSNCTLLNKACIDQTSLALHSRNPIYIKEFKNRTLTRCYLFSHSHWQMVCSPPGVSDDTILSAASMCGWELGQRRRSEDHPFSIFSIKNLII